MSVNRCKMCDGYGEIEVVYTSHGKTDLRTWRCPNCGGRGELHPDVGTVRASEWSIMRWQYDHDHKVGKFIGRSRPSSLASSRP